MCVIESMPDFHASCIVTCSHLEVSEKLQPTKALQIHVAVGRHDLNDAN